MTHEVRSRGEQTIKQVASVPIAEKKVWNPSGRVVAIDRDALRAIELLPPVNLERLIASQYQQIKRPLIASATGKSSTPIANGHLIMVASALSGEGKTFTSINLALSMALEQDTEVLLVDADVAKPHVSRIFGLRADRGLLDLLVDRNLSAESAILPTNVPGLSILPAGRQIATATELLASSRMTELVEELSSTAARRIVLFDSPPLLLSTESRALVHAVGQVVMVVRAQFTARKAVLDAIELLDDAKPISLVLNQSELAPSTGYYGYGSYGDEAPAVVGG
ncbi:MAG TPA: AAA family ATPase [Steroidobacteraceae bacterium]